METLRKRLELVNNAALVQFRFHDTVILGGHGPFTVFQHFGANEFHFRIDDVKTVLDGRDAGMLGVA